MIDSRTIRIADHYGYNRQVNQLVEEMAELAVALCKEQRLQPQDGETFWDYSERAWEIFDNIKEEIADVQLVLEQLIYLLKCANEVAAIKEKKIVRTLQRIDKGMN